MNRQYRIEQAKNRAKMLLVYYFKTAFIASSVPWHSDNQTEVEEIVESIFSAIEEMM